MGSKQGRRTSRVAVAIVGAVAAGLALAGPSAAVPLFPGGPDIPLPVIPGVPYLDRQFRFPASRVRRSRRPSASPTSPLRHSIRLRVRPSVSRSRSSFDSTRPSATVRRPNAPIRVTTDPPVEGSFYWINDSQVRWKPTQFWPANISVTVDAGESHSTFNIGDALVTVADDNTKQVTVTATARSCAPCRRRSASRATKHRTARTSSASSCATCTWIRPRTASRSILPRVTAPTSSTRREFPTVASSSMQLRGRLRNKVSPRQPRLPQCQHRGCQVVLRERWQGRPGDRAEHRRWSPQWRRRIG